MKKYSGILILLSIILAIASLLLSDTFYQSNSIIDYENREYEIEILLDLTIDIDSLFIVYLVEQNLYKIDDITAAYPCFVRKYVYKIKNHQVKESYKFGE
jgi:uncharacterized protein HemY